MGESASKAVEDAALGEGKEQDTLEGSLSR